MLDRSSPTMIRERKNQIGGYQGSRDQWATGMAIAPEMLVIALGHFVHIP
jgi:hypothetical protein